MVRPRCDAPGPNAAERLIDAFWEMLARMPYGSITISGISREAKVSPNTLYYHFDGILDIAQTAIASELSDEVADAIVDQTEKKGIVLARLLGDPRNATRAERIRLVAASGSSQLTSMLVDMLKQKWCALAGIAPGELSFEEELDLDFIYGGVVVVLASYRTKGGFETLVRFFDRPLGEGIAATMTNLEAHRKSERQN